MGRVTDNLHADLNGRCANGRRIANNTFKRPTADGGGIAIRLHSTDIIVVEPCGRNGRDDRVTLDTGGWQTVTTRDRLNAFLREHARGWGVYQERFLWWLAGDTTRVPFTDGMRIRIDRDGGIRVVSRIPNPERTAKRNAALRQRIREYAALCVSAMPLPLPDGGDCWYCLFRSDDGQTLGERSRNTAHLDDHLRERYVVPALVWTALQRAGCDPHGDGAAWYAAAFDNGPWGLCDTTLQRMIVRFLYGQYGLPR